MSRWIIQDWAGNVCFHAREFESFDDAWDFLFATVEEEDCQEYAVIPAGDVRSSRYLDPNDPRACLRAK